MKKPDEKILKALQRLKTTDDGSVFLVWLQDRLTEVRCQLGQIRDEVQVRWVQGQEQELSELVGYFTHALSVLEGKNIEATRKQRADGWNRY